MLGQPILSPQESLGRRHFAQMHNQAVALEAWCWEAAAAGVSWQVLNTCRLPGKDHRTVESPWTD